MEDNLNTSREVTFKINNKIFKAIVPDDKRFIYNNNHWVFTHYNSATELDSYYDHYDDIAIIAAYAAFCWNEKAKELYLNLFKENKVHDRYGIEDEEDNKKYMDLIDKDVQWQLICAECRKL